MNQTNNKTYIVPGPDRYCPPLNYELAGRSFELRIDGGPSMLLTFIDEKTAAWREGGGKQLDAFYKCLKADETTWFVSLEPAGEPPLVCISFVLDLANQLVTRVSAREDISGRRGILTGFRFGTIGGAGGSASSDRHRYTDELVGTVVQWITGPGRACVYDYFRADACRVGCAGPDEAAAGRIRPIGELPAAYIRIKDGLYLTCMTERIEDRALSLCCLQDYARLVAVGYAFGPLPSDNAGSSLVMLGAYGRLADG